MKLFLDSSAIIDFLKGDSNVAETIQDADELTTSTICAFEVIRGEEIRKKKGMKTHEQKFIDFLSRMKVFEFNMSDSKRAAVLSAELSSVGKKVNEFDVLIAAQVLERELTILTRDNDFKIFNERFGAKTIII